MEDHAAKRQKLGHSGFNEFSSTCNRLKQIIAAISESPNESINDKYQLFSSFQQDLKSIEGHLNDCRRKVRANAPYQVCK